jgi:hypothetical protein
LAAMREAALPRALSKLTLALLALPATCLTLCTFRVEPLHDWMMRHHCPVAWLAMHPPSRPIPELRSAKISR